MNLAEQVTENLKLTQINHQKKIDIIIQSLSIKEKNLRAFLNIVPMIEKIAIEHKMSIVTYSSNEGSGFLLSLEPNKDCKFIFLKDMGFDSHGNGKNQKQLDQKAEKIAEWFTSKIENITVKINPFSLEKHIEDKNSILCSIFINP